MAEIVDEHIDGLLKATSRSFHLTLTSLPNSVRDQVGAPVFASTLSRHNRRLKNQGC